MGGQRCEPASLSHHTFTVADLRMTSVNVSGTEPYHFDFNTEAYPVTAFHVLQSYDTTYFILGTYRCGVCSSVCSCVFMFVCECTCLCVCVCVRGLFLLCSQLLVWL